MENTLIRDLGDGLILRRSTPSDVDVLAELNSTVFRPREATGLNPYIARWTSDLLTLPHPNVTPDGFLLVQDTSSGKAVCSLVMIPQVWTYEGIPFGVGRPEMVTTLPEYRNRGLVRALFRAFHDWSAEQGHLAQVITGIPYFYRQFGYEMTIALGGGRSGPRTSAPKLKDGETEPYVFRPATAGDAYLLAEIHDHLARGGIVACPADEAYWRFELTGRSPDSATRQDFAVIETATGEPVGFVVTDRRFHGSTFEAYALGLRPGVSYGAVTPSLLRYLVKAGEERFARNADAFLWTGKPQKEIEFTTIALDLGAEHPAYDFVRQALPAVRNPYAWFIRLPDLEAFLRLIGPALERRLAESALVGHSGDLKLSFYRRGIRLGFERGTLTTVEAWKPDPDEWGTPRFPDLTFLQLLFGYRTLEELEYAFPDCGAGSDTDRALLGALFPKRASFIWARE